MMKTLFRWFTGHDDRKSLPAKVGGIFERMSPEGLCGINPTMARDEIRGRLAALYRRHNNAAGSLDPGLRREAEDMLDAIIHCREKYIDPAF